MHRIVAFGLIASCAAAAQGTKECAALTGAKSLPNPTTAIKSTVLNPASAAQGRTPALPEHCEVVGQMNDREGVNSQHYAIKFHLRLPTAWNGRALGNALGNLQGQQRGDALTLGTPLYLRIPAMTTASTTAREASRRRATSPAGEANISYEEIVTYLNFDGNCREDMTFYAKCLGGELTLTPFSEMPGNHPPEAEDRIMHARVSKKGAGLAVGLTLVMVSDRMPGMPFQQGGGFSTSIMCESADEVDRLFAALGKGARHRCRWRISPNGADTPLHISSGARGSGC